MRRAFTVISGIIFLVISIVAVFLITDWKDLSHLPLITTVGGLIGAISIFGILQYGYDAFRFFAEIANSRRGFTDEDVKWVKDHLPHVPAKEYEQRPQPQEALRKALFSTPAGGPRLVWLMGQQDSGKTVMGSFVADELLKRYRTQVVWSDKGNWQSAIEAYQLIYGIEASQRQLGRFWAQRILRDVSARLKVTDDDFEAFRRAIENKLNASKYPWLIVIDQADHEDFPFDLVLPHLLVA